MAKEHRILVPVDGSNCAIRALEHAASRLGTRKGGAIVLLNVQLPIPPSHFVTPEMIKDHQRRHSEPVIKRAITVLKRLNIACEVSMRIGDPAATIARVARQKRCSEIVTGSRGLGRWAGFVLGSTTMKLLHMTRLPVTVIR